jgi:hypothetical protein
MLRKPRSDTTLGGSAAPDVQQRIIAWLLEDKYINTPSIDRNVCGERFEPAERRRRGRSDNYVERLVSIASRYQSQLQPLLLRLSCGGDASGKSRAAGNPAEHWVLWTTVHV